MEKVYAFDPKKGRDVVIGTLKDRVFYKSVAKNHYCWKHHGFGIQLDKWSIIVSKADVIVFVYKKKEYRIKISRAEIVKISDNLGHGPQYFIKEEHCEVNKDDTPNNSRTNSPKEEQPKELQDKDRADDKPAQRSLF